MNKDLVIVASKTINNESVAVTIHVAEVKQGGLIDRREISRSFVFEDFESVMPLGMAEILLKRNPDEYIIIGPADGNMTPEIEAAMNVKKKAAKKKPAAKKPAKKKTATKTKRGPKRKTKNKAEAAKTDKAPEAQVTEEKKEQPSEEKQE